MDMEADLTGGLKAIAERFQAWLQTDFLTYATIVEVLVLAMAGLLAYVGSRWIRQGLETISGDIPYYDRTAPIFGPLIQPALALLLVATGLYLLPQFGLPTGLLRITVSLLTAWLVIRLAVNFIRSRALQRLVATIAWSIAALDIFQLLDPIVTVLDRARISFGETTISALGIINGAFAFVILIWLALLASRLIEGRVDGLHDVNPSARELVKKLTKIGLVTLALMVALNSTGIDLTALAVFGGALGVGIGFGLQKVVGNFISGVILLLDHSIKPGDVIETQGTYGWINRLAARYTSIITRDGTEFLIPNEDMITQPVINWSHTHPRVRRKVPVQVSYSSDIDLAMKLMVDAASEHPRILEVPGPRCLLKEFGSDGVNLELRMWIQDPQNGVSNVASDVMLKIWESFHDKGIQFPFPQRSLHVESVKPDVAELLTSRAPTGSGGQARRTPKK